MTEPALSVADFASKVVKTPRWPHQRELVESTAFIATAAAARRAGKTEAAEILALHTAFSWRERRVIILSAGQDAGTTAHRLQRRAPQPRES